MKIPRVKKGKGPKSAMTQATYRKKALSHLLTDFEGRCAYCMDPKEFRSESQTQVDHFDCKIRGRKRHYYKNLMLACAACNLYKHDKPVVNQFDQEQKLINCTEENEFLGHVQESPNGQWHPLTKSALYHLESIGLTAECHRIKRCARRQMLQQIVSLVTTACQYQTDNPRAVHEEMMKTIGMLLDHLDNFPPMVNENGVYSAKDWLKSKGIDISLFAAHVTPSAVNQPSKTV